MKSTGILIIGIGRAGIIHCNNFLSKIPNVSVEAICDVSKESVDDFADKNGIKNRFTDYNEALKCRKVDAVVVVTPTKYHKDIVIAAAKAKKHIFCEKPMAMNVEECEEMIKAAKENNVKLQIGFMRRFDDNFVRAKEIVDSGEIGDIVSVRSVTHGPSTPKEWMYDISKSNGPLAEVSSHDIDTIRWFTESDADSLYAIAGNYRCPQAKENYPDFYDSVMVTMKMKNGTMGCIDGAQGVEYGYDSQVEILGTKGKIVIGDLKSKSVVTYTKTNGVSSDIVTSWTELFTDAYLKEDIGFIDCIVNDTEPKVTGYDGMMAVAIVNAGNNSIQSGEIVTLGRLLIK